MKDYDIVVFGGTPCGVAAACTAAELGAHVLLMETSHHVGGHLSSGICTTEVEHMLPESFRGWMMRFFVCDRTALWSGGAVASMGAAHCGIRV